MAHRPKNKYLQECERVMEEIAQTIGERRQLDPKEVSGVIEDLFEEIKARCKDPGSRFVIVRFGAFTAQRRGGRRYRHPTTGEIQRGQDRCFVTFKAAAGFQDMLDEASPPMRIKPPLDR